MKAVWWPLAAFGIFAPPFAFERMAQYSYTIHNGLFFIFSGQRFPFDIYYLAISVGVLGYLSKSLRRSWVTASLAITALLLSFFVVCEPKLCYSTGYDGLEPARVWVFFITLAIGAAYAGHTLAKGTEPSRGDVLLTAGAAFYAVAYYPVIFAIAGVRLVSPFDFLAYPLFVSIAAFVFASNFMSRTGRRTSLSVTSAIGLMLVLGSGIAKQYLAQGLPTLELTLASALAGTLGASLIPKRAKFVRWFERSKIPVSALIIYVILAVLVIPPDAAVGIVTSSHGLEYPSEYSTTSVMLAGGMMASPMVRPRAVAVNLTFLISGLDAIPDGGFVGGGIWVHSADCCTDGIDYGYRFDLRVYSNRSETYVAEGWRVCDANGGCDGHSWKVLMYHREQVIGEYANGWSAKAEIGWNNRTVEWTYSSGNRTVTVGAFEPPSSENAAFNAGWDGPGPAPFPGGPNYYQWGVSSSSRLNEGWSVRFNCPAFQFSGKWSCVDKAVTLQGSQTYWKALWRWGEDMRNVEAVSNSTARSVLFRWSDSTLESFQPLWG